jgi:16S rRNA (guanine966-N2)-methyltransferase
MRIIAGRHRGRRLEAPPGEAVRPTGERAREALFDILGHGRFAEQPVWLDAAVLDVFAGTGAFGLEALSRGARHATFLDRSIAALARNVAALDERPRATLLKGDALRPPRTTAACSLVFLDPPYAEDIAAAAVTALDAAGWLAPDALVVVELPAARTLAPPPGFTLLDERRYGAARLVFLRRVGEG